jgi:hydrogenase nickel incorporation protein HypA/HybF
VHEYSIARALLATVAAQSRTRSARAVHRLHVRIGELSGVEPELLATAYLLCRARTICAGAELAIERVAARWSCSRCARDLERGGHLRCPACGGPARLLSGDEILLERIEMEVP